MSCAACVMSGVEQHVYIDTSALLAYYRPEPVSDVVDQFLRYAAVPVGISALTEVEFASGLARLTRTGELTKRQAGQIADAFGADLRAGLFCRMSLTAAHYRKARDWLFDMQTALRILDALHLACSDAHNMLLLSADTTLSESAQVLAINCRLVAPDS